MIAPELVTVLVDCPKCEAADRVSDVQMVAVTQRGSTYFGCACGNTWWAGLPEGEVCGAGFGGGASCGLPDGHDYACIPART